MPTNPFLQGNFAPVHEEVTAFDLPVTGHIPAELQGRYLRNGPNPVKPPDPATYHWFVGEGMVHGIRLRDGKAEWYRNRWVRSAAVAEALGETWAGGPVHANRDFAANTHIIGHAGQTLALVEGGALPYALSYELDTVGPWSFHGTLPGGYTAHPKLDPDTGSLHAVAYSSRWSHVQYVVIGPDGRVSRVEEVPTPGRPMMHDFSLTERYVVLYDLPVVFDEAMAQAGRRPAYTWSDTYGARLGVMPRNGGAADLRWFEIAPCYVFHPMNAYDEDGRIVLDVARHERMFDPATGGMPSAPPTLDRWVVDMDRGVVTETRLDDRPQEFPRVDERCVSKRHRYGYTVVTGAEMTDLDRDAGGLAKHDLSRGTSTLHALGPGSSAGEGVFVPRSADAAEDDGYVMALVFDPARGASDLLILAAQDFAGPPVARVHLPARVPLGFHGSWIPDAP